ncbi:phosphotransferase-like protein [Lacticaseibacillus kribbianus]|uniref:phosphotransferase-like protein n=1 Tax=Lacticaseibacillus kribbianus TaxID=2926292 RepID=UPI001CD5E1D8|nr:hypothetical protein [Lacticaseibacillus kribbianus]
MTPGQIVVLNGQPRAGKSSIARAIQDTFPGTWLALGVDLQMQALPAALQPGIGLRPGGERPDLEPTIQRLYAGLFAAMAGYSRAGLNVVADLGIHDDYSRPLGIGAAMHRTLTGLPLTVVGVTAPPAVIAARRLATWHTLPEPAVLARWANATAATPVDLWIDTEQTPAAQAAAVIRDWLRKHRGFELD